MGENIMLKVSNAESIHGKERGLKGSAGRKSEMHYSNKYRGIEANVAAFLPSIFFLHDLVLMCLQLHIAVNILRTDINLFLPSAPLLPPKTPHLPRPQTPRTCA